MSRSTQRNAVAALYDRSAAGYDQRLGEHPVSLKRLRVVEAPLRRLAARAMRILDLGCGTGRVAAALSGPRVIGIDISFAMLRQAAAKGARVCRADAHALPFPAETFDLVLAANGVFGYLRAADALRECARALRPGGRLACHQYASRVQTPRRSEPGHLGQRRDLEGVAEFESAARACGLELVERHLWRGLRTWPHVVRVPWLLGARLWDHGVFVFEKPAGAHGQRCRA